MRSESMPKIIRELRAQFVAAARQRLLPTPDHDMTIRQVAEDCHTGVGTVYNYFPSKEMLIAQVILKDWQDMKLRIAENMGASEEPIENIQRIYTELRRFVTDCLPIWEKHANVLKSFEMQTHYHPSVIRQLSEFIQLIIDHYSLNVEPKTDIVLSEIMLSLAKQKEDQFPQIQPVLCRILGIQNRTE